jgi:hypothetical protein
MKMGTAGVREKLSKVKPSIVFLVFAILIGGYLRLSRPLSADFPLNDGGLFYQMTRELVENHFRIPSFTNYNALGIPYAYPPLAFYLTAGLSQLFGWQLLDIFRLFPAVISILTIPAAFLLIKDLTDDDKLLSLSILIFSLIPVTFDWVIMGGGVTRALGFLFALLALHFTIVLFKRKKIGDLFFAAIFLSLAIVSHPETGFHAAVSVPVLWFFLNRNKKGAWHTGLMALVTILLTAPWWGSVLQSHGLTPFLSAFSTSEQNGNAFFFPLNVTLTNETGTGSIAILALIGCLLYLAKKQWFLPLWAVISYTVAPRSAKIFIAPIVAIFAAYTIVLLVNWLDARKNNNESILEPSRFLSSVFSQIFLAIMFLQWFPSSMRVLNQFSTNRLSEGERTAFTWIYENTEINSKFVVLSDYFWSADPISEWFPVLTGRASVATVQGTEWLGGGDYEIAKQKALDLRNCVDQTQQCIDTWAQDYDAAYEYLYVRQLRAQNSVELVPYKNALVELLKNDPSYTLVYETDEVAIFEKK